MSGAAPKSAPGPSAPGPSAPGPSAPGPTPPGPTPGPSEPSSPPGPTSSKPTSESTKKVTVSYTKSTGLCVAEITAKIERQFYIENSHGVTIQTQHMNVLCPDKDTLNDVYINPIFWFNKFCSHKVRLIEGVNHKGFPPVKDTIIIETQQPHLLYLQFKKHGVKLLGKYITAEEKAVYEITNV